MTDSRSIFRYRPRSIRFGFNRGGVVYFLRKVNTYLSLKVNWLCVPVSYPLANFVNMASTKLPGWRRALNLSWVGPFWASVGRGGSFQRRTQLRVECASVLCGMYWTVTSWVANAVASEKSIHTRELGTCCYFCLLFRISLVLGIEAIRIAL